MAANRAQESGYNELEAATEGARVISSDVFDTLLLRTLRAERSRIVLAERRFADQLSLSGVRVSADALVDARLLVQRSAFRVLDMAGSGEVRLTDIIAGQLRLLGLPEALLELRLGLELAVERESLIANRKLAELLRRRRAQGARVLALSDTTLTAAQVQSLLDHFHGPGLVDKVYSSADLAATKRGGSLFTAVAAAERFALQDLVHLGDDAWADVRVPVSLGARAVHLTRPAVLQRLRSARGAATEAGRRLRVVARDDKQILAPEAFATETLGPILTHFCQRIWLHASQVEQSHSAVLLFCARGGIGIREFFERGLVKLELPLRMRRENLLVSRLVAARAALLVGSATAIEELGREFTSESFASVAQALGGRAYDLPAAWQRKFVASELLGLLHAADGVEILADIRGQNDLFERHLRGLVQGAERLILCDTGLYGSTLRLLAQGFPDLRFEALQFARSNYKGFAEEHFPRVVGLMVQDNFYNPLNPVSCVLRYWHLVESLFEPKLQSVRSFQLSADGGVSANCGAVEHGTLPPELFSPLLTAAMRYLERLPQAAGALVFSDAEQAVTQLRRIIAYPSSAHVRALNVSTRSKDFGRDGTMEVIASEAAGHFVGRLRAIKSQHWREGAISRDFPWLRHVLLPALSSVHLLRRFLGRR